MGSRPLSFQQLILTLHHYWSDRGCLILQPYDMEMGAGTFHPATTLRALGPDPWKAAFVQPSRRPTDGRYGDNPNRLQHYYQYQVILKPSPPDLQDLYLGSLAAIGVDPLKHDIRFVEDDWESPTLGAWGLGWEVWCDGMEVTQFTYFQQVGGFDCKPVAGELTYGLERLAMYIQGVDSVYDLVFNDEGVTYGQVFHENEVEFSAYNFEVADSDSLFDRFRQAAEECRRCIEAKLPLPAYDQAIKASHIFNTLQARGVISVAERQAYIGRVRDLAKGACQAWMDKNGVGGVSDFLLELLSEEIPARMQDKARADLARLLEEQLGEAGLKTSAIETYATPRRLALIARDLPDATDAVSEELKGPRSSAPPQALEGFLRKTGLTQDQLVERDGIWFATRDKPGRASAEVLAEAIPAIVRVFPWPKSMRWGEASASTESPRWVRPLHGIVAILGDKVVEFDVAGVKSGAATVGHRFHHPGPITIGGAHDYVEKLRACHVVVDQEERKAIIRKELDKLQRNTKTIPDEGLVIENAGLTEWPVPLKGSFDASFLALPPELIRLTMRVNQKYFACADDEGELSNRFVCVANIASSDPAAVVAGNEKVLAARLSDAKFFWDQDLRTPLADQAKKLDQIVFHEKLGTVALKAERVAKLAEWLVRERFVRADMAEVKAAAQLAKADLVTEMVGEFPELQGVIGGYYARAQGQSGGVASAIRDHYKPAGQSDDVPADPVTIAVNIADRVDTLVAFFSIGEKPTGSRDPFALRRAALALIRLVTVNGLRLPLFDVFVQAAVLNIVGRMGALGSVTYPDLLDGDENEHEITASVGGYTYRHGDHVLVRWDSALTPNIERGEIIEEATGGAEQLLDFLGDRLKVQQREAGVRHDLIEAVFALRDQGEPEDDLVRLLSRVSALQASVETQEGADLLAGYKRAANILKRENWSTTPVAGPRRSNVLSYTAQNEETELDEALDAAEPKVAAALADEDYERAMRALATLRVPIDAFFEKVTVNDPDAAKREVRLDLLARIRALVHRVADFSKIEG